MVYGGFGVWVGLVGVGVVGAVKQSLAMTMGERINEW
jgi:hypothetical protein